MSVTQSASGPVDHLLAALVAPCRYTRLSARQADLDEVLKIDSTIWQRLCHDRLFRDFDSTTDRVKCRFGGATWQRVCQDRLIRDFDSTTDRDMCRFGDVHSKIVLESRDVVSFPRRWRRERAL